MSSSSTPSSSSDDVPKLHQQVQQGYDFIKKVAEARRKKKKEALVPKLRKRATPKQYIDRDREGGAVRLFNDYFAENPTWGDATFCHHFRMSRQLFLRIVQLLESRDPYFQQRVDAIGRDGFKTIQKCTVALRQLGNGGSADHYDEYLRMAESTGIETMKRFCKSIISIFGSEYLRRPTGADCERLLRMHEGLHGFPGMLGNIDCMHWYWKNCPVAWKGAYTRGDKGHPAIILEAVASHDLWIWHAFFGVAGSNNDINVLNQSPVFSDVVNGIAPLIPFTVNERTYNISYYLADGLYPKWPTLVSSPTVATNPKVQLFKTKQESARKDMLRAFEVLQMRWRSIKGPTVKAM